MIVNEDITDKIKKLALINPHISNAFRIQKNYNRTYEDALEIMVIALAGAADDFEKKAIEYAQKMPVDNYNRGYAAAVNDCIEAAKMTDRSGHEWVKDSLYDSIIKRIVTRLKKLRKQK